MAIRYPLLLVISLTTAATAFAAMPGSGRVSPLAPTLAMPEAGAANVTVLYKNSPFPVMGTVQPLDFPNARY